MWRVGFFILAVSIVVQTLDNRVDDVDDSDSENNREAKVLPIFQVVRFPNDVCSGSSSRNGTCYTA